MRVPQQGRSIRQVKLLGGWSRLQHHPLGFSAFFLSVYNKGDETESSRSTDSKSDKAVSPKPRIHVSTLPKQQQLQMIIFDCRLLF